MIIGIKSSAAGGRSSRGLVHYLAHSKFDPEKEATERREFFNESANDLDVREANRHLTRDNAKPAPEELMHLVIAPSDDEIERIGDDLESRKAALRLIVRNTIAELKKEVKARNLKWVAALHFNTAHPHAHVALQKQFLNEDGKPEILRINRQLLYYNEKDANGEKKLHQGALITAAEKTIENIAAERQKVQVKEKNLQPEKVSDRAKPEKSNFNHLTADAKHGIADFDERRILAQEMLIKAEIRRRERNIENLIEHGDQKRFKIKEESTGRIRRVSLFDLERKIEISSRRQALLTHPDHPEKRAALAAKIAAGERASYEPVIRQLATIRHHVLGFENRHLSAAQEKHMSLHNQKLLIEKKYQRQKASVPLPAFKSNEIQELQSQAFQEGNLEQIRLLEEIRRANAAEFKRPVRRESEARELLATKIIAELKAQASEKRLDAFLENKGHYQVKIGDSLWSQHQLDHHELRAAGKKDLWTKFKTKASEIFFAADQKNPFPEKLDYPALRKSVAEAVANLETAQLNKITQQKEFLQTIDEILAAETNPQLKVLSPKFSAQELSLAEDLALAAGREEFYEHALLWQENWLREKLTEHLLPENASVGAQQFTEIKNQKSESSAAANSPQIQPETSSQISAEKIIGEFILGRAAARQIIAEVKTIEAQDNLFRQKRNKPFVKHRVKDAETGAEIELSLRDVEPRRNYYLLDSILESALGSMKRKNLRDQVRQAADKQEKKLIQNLQHTQNRSSRLEDQKTQLLEKFSALAPAAATIAPTPEILPIFTPKEISALETWTAQTLNKAAAERLEKIITDAEKNHRVEKLPEFLEQAAKKLQLIERNPPQTHEADLSQKINGGGASQTIIQSRETAHEKAAAQPKERFR